MTPRSRLDGIVIRQQPVAEADVIVSIASAHEGRVEVLARGARKSSKRFAGGVALFSEISAVIEQGRGHLPTLVESSLERTFLPQTPTYGQLALASYVAELTSCASQPSHADPGLYAWLQASLALCAVADEQQLRTPRLGIEVGFLQAAGVFPELQVCAHCGQETSGGGSWLDADVGLVCTRCLPPQMDALPPALVRALVLWSLAPPEPPIALLPASAALRLTEKRIAELLGHVLPPNLRSATALRDLLRFEG
jgi:DNA repair protein RecO (recombination protein O)